MGDPEGASERAIEDYSRRSEQGPLDPPPPRAYDVTVRMRVLGPDITDEHAARMFVHALITEGSQAFEDELRQTLASTRVESIEEV